ncbi:hypothetical protein [Sellimonas catena]|uniref:hypothetical protein n=1 Tax=Sellimonas catena TaxID=2994035 RepID=UPI00248FA453|nr:hypothetical protein [Sellimonas catena]
MTDYEWLTQMGLCHRCRKKKSAPDKKFCFDCVEKIREENRMRYDPEYAKAYRSKRRELYEEKKKKGICIRCSKKATHGMYCYECSIKTKRQRQKRSEKEKAIRHEKGLIPDERKRRGLCLWCGKAAVPGLQCCEKHREIFREAGKKNVQKVR